MGTLHKIFILTISYQFVVMLGIFMMPLIFYETQRILFWTYYGLLSFSWSYSMYLMMDHNEDKYIQFLKRMYRFKCDYICYCCCRFMIVEQLNRLDPDVSDQEANNTASHQIPNQQEDSQWETRSASIQDYKIKTTPNELSIDTTIAESVN